MEAFTPVFGQTVNIVVSASSQSIPVSVNPNEDGQVRIFNDGTATVWVSFGRTNQSPTVATSTGMPIPAGGVEIVSVPPLGGTVSACAIAAGATGTVYFTPGDGL